MKGKTILQQSFKKVQSQQRITIKINRPNYNTPQSHNASINQPPLQNIVQEEIRQIKNIISKAEKILQLSRRQQKSPIKVVASDSIPIRFNYQSAKPQSNHFQLYPLDERDSQDSLFNESEGSIQLPVHLEPSIDERNYMTAQESFRQYSKNLKERYKTEAFDRSWETDRYIELNEVTNSLQKKLEKKSLEKPKTPKSTSSNGFYKLHFKKEKQRYKGISNGEDKRIFQTIEEEIQRRKKLVSKQKKTIKLKQNQNQNKVKIKLNRPNQFSKNAIRPRYHIQMPEQAKPIASQQKIKLKSIQKSKSDWQRLKQNVEKYEFVKKYLLEPDLYQIYEYLKKNHINQQRWPLFVVDEAYNKMYASRAK